VSDDLDLAQDQLDKVKLLSSQVGLEYEELPPQPTGVGIAMSWRETDFIVLSVIGYGSENQLWLTCGALRDIRQDRLAALDACNKLNQADCAHPFFLHDAPTEWDILVQQTYPVQLLLDVPRFFANCCTSLPGVTEQARKEFFGDLGGSPYSWTVEDVDRLLAHSML
jgi:hypothetical protein